MSNDSMSAALLVEKGEEASRAGDRSEAKDCFRAALELHPQNGVAWLRLAKVVANAGEAIRCLREAISIDPSNEEAAAALSSALLRQGIAAAKARDARAEELLRESLQFEPDKKLAWMWLAAAVDSHAEKVRCLERVLELDPENLDAKSYLARLKEQEVPGIAVSRPIVAEPQPVEPAVAVPNSPPPAKSMPTIMVVDDSATVRKIVGVCLERRGYKVRAASSGLEALSILGEVSPALILLDITMPHMDGYQVCKLMRENQHARRVPILMLSGRNGLLDKARARMAGFIDFVTKPFEPATLVHAVERYCPAGVGSGGGNPR